MPSAQSIETRPFKYAERYVVFVDIIGFGAIIERSANNEQLVGELAAVLHQIGGNKKFSEAADDFQALQFSDSIVMSTAASSLSLAYLFYTVSELALALLKKGLLIRGGVAKGSLYHHGSVAFGPAFIEAFRIESRIARYPRVVLSSSVWADVDRFSKTDADWDREDVKLADDGPAYVHLFRPIERVLRARNETDRKNFLNERYGSEYLTLHATLQALIRQAMHDPNHYEKVKWFAVYWNSTIASEKHSPFEMVEFPNWMKRDGI